MAFDESEHPRDGDGKFTDGSGGRVSTNEMIRAIVKAGKELPLDRYGAIDTLRLEQEYGKLDLQFFGKRSPDGWKNSEKRKREEESNAPAEIPQRPQKASGFARLKTKHHTQHMVDMGFKDEASYQRAAMEFWENGKGTIYYSTLRKNFAKESADKSKIVVVESDGTIKTYFPFKTKKARDRYLIQDRWEEIERA